MTDINKLGVGCSLEALTSLGLNVYVE